MIKIILAVLFFSFSSNCLAGRPVFRDLPLFDLAHSSDAIAIVTKASPFAVSVKDKFSCERHELVFSVDKVIKADLSVSLRAGDEIHVLQNVTGVTDCIFREGWKTSGVSFSAERYQPSNPSALAEQEKLIVFLVLRNGKFELRTENAFEELKQQKNIEALFR